MMESEMVDILVPIVLFIVIGVTLIAAFSFKFLERKRLYEKDIPAQDLYNLIGMEGNGRHSYWLIVTGTIMIFFSIGLGVGILIDKATSEDSLVIMSIFCITGIGFIVSHYYSSLLIRKEA
jgi:positive regulator of sigma E activity